MNICNIHVTKVDPHSLTENDFLQLHEVTQDMWAEGLGELVQCNECGNIQGKEDVFQGIPENIYHTTVGNIMRVLRVTKIPCQTCGGDTHFIYGDHHHDQLKDKLLNSEISRIALVKANNEIVGNGAYYVAPLDKIYRNEFTEHYGTTGIQIIRNRIFEVLGWHPEKMVMFSSIGFIEKYKNPFHLFELLRNAAETLPDIGEKIPGIMELDRYNPMHRIFTASGGLSLNIKKVVGNFVVNNTTEKYDSDIVVFPNPLASFQENFTHGPRSFLRKLSTVNS